MSRSTQLNSGIRDNHSRGKAGEFLRPLLKEETSLSIVSAYFTIHAYQALKAELDGIEKLRFLFGEPTFVSNVNQDDKESREFKLTEEGLKLSNQLFRNKQLKRMQDEILDLEDFDDNITLSDFSLDEFRIDLLQFLESRRAELEAAQPGLYAVVPTKPDQPIGQPGVIFCFRHRSGDSDLPTGKESDSAKKINPLGRYYLIYVHDDGTVRLSFTQPKQALNLFRDLAAGLPSAQDRLCDLFDQQTNDGADMSHYSELIRKATASIAHTFTKRAAASLFAGRDGKLPTEEETPNELEHEYELLTWLAMMGEA